MNEFDHFKVEIEQLDIHFLHHKSSHASAIPLVLIHGWPGSYLEFLHVIPLLTNPPGKVSSSPHSFASLLLTTSLSSDQMENKRSTLLYRRNLDSLSVRLPRVINGKWRTLRESLTS